VYDWCVHPLSAHRFLVRVALSLSQIFAWILVFDATYSVTQSVTDSLAVTVLAYAMVHALAFLLTPVAARALQFGVRRMIDYAVLSYATALVLIGSAFIGLLGEGLYNMWYGLLGFVLLNGLFRSLYFVAYRTESYDSRTQRLSLGHEVSLALMPLAGAIVLTGATLGFFWLPLLAAFVLLIALLPLSYTREMYEDYSWGYGETYTQLIEPRHRAIVVKSILDGVQGTGLILLWPLAIFLILDWSYIMLGGVLSATALILLAVNRHFSHHLAKKPSDDIIAICTVGAWGMRCLAFSPVSMIAADVLHEVTVGRSRHSVDAHSFEQHADMGHYVDELTTLKQISLAAGRVFTALVVVALASSQSVHLMLGGGFALSLIAGFYAAYSHRLTNTEEM